MLSFTFILPYRVNDLAEGLGLLDAIAPMREHEVSSEAELSPVIVRIAEKLTAESEKALQAALADDWSS